MTRQEVADRHPSWHLFVSDAGHLWAVRIHKPDDTGCGVTVGGRDEDYLHTEIRKAEAERAALLDRWGIAA